MTDLLIPTSGYRELTIDEILRRKALIDGAPSNADQTTLPSPKIVSSGFKVLESDDRYTFGPVSHRNELYHVSLSKGHLDSGYTTTQDSWIKSLKRSEWSIANVPLQIDCLSTLLRESDGEYKGLIATLRDMYAIDYNGVGSSVRTVTASSIRYAATDRDAVIHRYGVVGKTITDATIVGPDGWLMNNFAEHAIEALLGRSDISSLNAISQWLYGSDMYLHRRIVRHKTVRHYALVLGVDNRENRFTINADERMGKERPARGVVLQKIVPSEAPR